MASLRDQLHAATQDMRGKQQHKVVRQRRRALPDEVLDWMDIASKREPPRPRDKQTLRNYLQAKNPRRWFALQRHLRWAEGEMLKLGMNPEDTRWLL